MNAMPGFTAEVSLSQNRLPYRMVAGSNHNDASVVIPQLSCWRVCYDISSTNQELAGCWRACTSIKEIFGF